MHVKNDQRGLLSPLIVVVFMLVLLVVGLGGFGGWAYLNYVDQRDNVNQKITTAVSAAKAAQSAADSATFAEQTKSPTLQFVGSPDLGSVKFNYPKTWSGFVYNDGSNGNFQAYFNPGVVPMITNQSQFALRVSIVGASYDNILGTFKTSLTSGAVKASSVTAGGETGIRLDGAIENNISGSMVIMKIRDQTLEVYTESKTFQHDFDTFVVPSLTFNR